MFNFGKKQIPSEVVGVRVRVSMRARRMALRVDARAGDIVLTWPRGGSMRAAQRFIEENRDWIDSRRRKMPAVQLFASGKKISVQGRDYEIAHRTGRGVTRFEGDYLIVHGSGDHLSRRVRDFLKETARNLLENATRQKLGRIGLAPAGIRVIDPKTRWGSCSPDGRLMFSWRLVLAPPDVLDYVVAHEVAHCLHMNHGKKFWALCASLTKDAAASRRWLKMHGAAIMAYR